MKKPKLLIPLFVLIFLVAITYFFRGDILSLLHQPKTSSPPESKQTQEIKSVRVAFVGDSGLNDNTTKVLNLIKTESSNLLVHLGDYDYEDDPSDWNEEVNKTLGETFNIIPVIGNHDLKAWPEYEQSWKAHLAKTPEVACSGEVAVKMTCNFRGIYFVISGIGTWGENQEEFIKDNIDNGSSLWRVCVWHKNQKLMQVGGKNNEVGWGAYETCRKAGAIIATAHEHSYERTHLLNNFETQAITSTSNILELTKGKTFAFVSGLGGHSIRDQNDELAKNPWWAKIYTEDQNAKPGALFCDFFTNNNLNEAKCNFKNIDGEVVDEFKIKTSNN